MKSAVTALLILALAVLISAAERTVEATFQNRTSTRTDFYVDGHLACTALSNLTCSSMEKDTDHDLEARQNDRVVKSRHVSQHEFQEGSYIWGVCIVGKTCPSN